MSETDTELEPENFLGRKRNWIRKASISRNGIGNGIGSEFESIWKVQLVKWSRISLTNKWKVKKHKLHNSLIFVLRIGKYIFHKYNFMKNVSSETSKIIFLRTYDEECVSSILISLLQTCMICASHRFLGAFLGKVYTSRNFMDRFSSFFRIRLSNSITKRRTKFQVQIQFFRMSVWKG